MRWICASLLLLAAASPASAVTFAAYRCADGARIAAAYLPGDEARVHLSTSGGAVTLDQVRAASGAKYEGRGWLWWAKGAEATLAAPDGRTTVCTATD